MAKKAKQPSQLIDSQDQPEARLSNGKTILTVDHRLAMARLILENKATIKGIGKSLEIKADKRRVWQEIYDHMISLGAVIPNVRHLCKNLFDNMKKTARDKVKNNNTTGAALKVLTAVDELMMDYEGRESVYMVGLQEPDNPPVLPDENEDSNLSFMEDIEEQSVHLPQSSIPGPSTATTVSFRQTSDEILTLPLNVSDQENEVVIPYSSGPSPQARATNRKRPVRSPEDPAIWEDSQYKALKHDLMQSQIEEIKSKIDRNKALTKEANLKSQFWERALVSLENGSLVMELRSTNQGPSFVFADGMSAQ